MAAVDVATGGCAAILSWALARSMVRIWIWRFMDSKRCSIPEVGHSCRILSILSLVPRSLGLFFFSSCSGGFFNCWCEKTQEDTLKVFICNHTFPVYLISTSLYPRRTADMHTYIEKRRFSPLTTLPLSLGS